MEHLPSTIHFFSNPLQKFVCLCIHFLCNRSFSLIEKRIYLDTDFYWLFLPLLIDFFPHLQNQSIQSPLFELL